MYNKDLYRYKNRKHFEKKRRGNSNHPDCSLDVAYDDISRIQFWYMNITISRSREQPPLPA